MVDSWTIRERVHSPAEETSRATVFALANGYMGLRGAGEEVAASIPGVKGCYINGIYDTPSGALTEREIPNIPDWTCVRLYVNGDPFDLATGEILEFARELDMRTGMVRRRIRWRSPGGLTLRIATERFLSMARPHIGFIRWRIQTDVAAEFELASSTDIDVNNRWASHFRAMRAGSTDAGVFTEVETFNPGYRIAVMTHTTVRAANMEFADIHTHGARRTWRDRISASSPVEMTKWASVFDSRFTPGDLMAACDSELKAAREAGADAVYREHARVWERLWDAADVRIEGDIDAQMGIRFSVFHLLAAAPRHSGELSIPGRGLQGQDYYGSIFWDCEIFVFPFFAYTHPRIARNLLQYRVGTLDGARRKARSLEYEGAYFAWQSQESGDEQCALYVFDNPMTGEKIRSYFADEQIHISADILYAAVQYVEATGDEGFWEQGGVDLVVEIARFYASRVTEMPDGSFALNSALGPDEYHERVNNNAFTNAMTQFALRRTGEIVGQMLEQGADVRDELETRLRLTSDEPQRWRDIAARLTQKEPAPETGLIEQFDGYFDLEDVSVEETRSRLAHPELHPGGPLGPFQRTQNIKQADVVMLLYLFRNLFDHQIKLANWEYYEPRTAHDSSLSPMAYSLVAADVGKTEWAYKYFMHSALIDLASYGPHWNLGIHAAALGGAWLAVVHGFCGIRLAEDGVRLDHWPRLPSAWSELHFKLKWHGICLSFVVQKGDLRISSQGDQSVPLHTPEGRHTVEAWQTAKYQF